MNSFDKAFGVLEYVLNKDGLPSVPTEIASALAINRATCSRIVTMLLKKGYIEKVSRRTGYVPGPALFALSARRSPYARLAKAAEGPLQELAARIGVIVNLSVMRGGLRYILAHCAANPAQRLPLQTSYLDNHYVSATGRLLLSVAPREDVDFVVGALGFPKGQWDGIDDTESLHKALAELARKKTIKYPQDNVWIVGGRVEAAQCPPAAIGFGVKTEAKAEEAVVAVKEAAAKIEAALGQGPDKNTSLY